MPFKNTYTDQLGRQVAIPANPQRIISTVPSQTELLFYLGLGDRVIGVTKFCIHPAEAVAAKVKIGGTKQLDIEIVRSLKPDLIIANKEENERSQIEALMPCCPVWTSDVNSLDSALQMITSVGEITNTPAAANQLKDIISLNFQHLTPLARPLSAAYLIWRKPYMAAGAGTYINDMLGRCGFVNCINEPRYPEVSIERLGRLSPDVILLSSEPYPFSQKHVDQISLIVPTASVILVDGEMFSWYGSRLLFAAGYFAEVIKNIENQPKSNYL